MHRALQGLFGYPKKFLKWFKIKILLCKAEYVYLSFGILQIRLVIHEGQTPPGPNRVLKDIFQKYYVVLEQLAVKNLFSTYVWSKVYSCFCKALYICQEQSQNLHEKLTDSNSAQCIILILNFSFELIQN